MLHLYLSCIVIWTKQASQPSCQSRYGKLLGKGKQTWNLEGGNVFSCQLRGLKYTKKDKQVIFNIVISHTHSGTKILSKVYKWGATAVSLIWKDDLGELTTWNVFNIFSPQFCPAFRAVVAPPGTSRATCPRRGSGSPMSARSRPFCLPLWSRLLLPLRPAWRSGGWGSVPLWSALLQERVSLHRKWDRWNQSGCLIRLLSATKSELSRASDPSSENGIRLEPVLGRSARLGWLNHFRTEKN